MAIICISRQRGSLGNEIAQGLADTLNYHLLSREIISNMLAESGFSQEESIDSFSVERRPSFLNSFVVDRDRFICYIKKVVYEFAQKQDVIIMGMGGQALFRNFPNTLRVRIIAPPEVRITRIQEKQACHERYAMHIIEESDRARAGFNKYFFDIDWEAIDLYDLIISTSAISLEGAIRLLKEEIQDIDRAEHQEETAGKLQAMVLRQSVLISILYEARLGISYLNISIDDGTVTLNGFSNSTEERDQCEATVRNVPGVKEVINEIVVEPAAFAC